MSARRGAIGVRGYALTPWARAFVDVAEGRFTGEGGAPAVESRKITKARSYFRDRHVHQLALSAGEITSSVQGSQLDPFDVIVSVRTVDTPTVASLLRTADAVTEVMGLARGEQPRTLGELVAPTESADLSGTCTCPDDSGRCIHVLATVYEVAAEIDRRPATLLTVMGTSLAELLRAIEELADPDPDTDRGAGTAATSTDDAALRDGEAPPRPPTVDYYGTGASAPPPPSPPRITPLSDLDGGALRAALRASGVAPADIAEAVDELGDLYDRIVDE